MIDFIVTIIILLILGAAISYIVRAKRRGEKCIGCPDAATCAHKGQEGSGCGGCDGGNRDGGDSMYR